MNPRNAASHAQRYHGSQQPGCGCMSGHHIWDKAYEKETKHEQWCVCCEHFFLSDEMEDSAAEAAVNPNAAKPTNSQGGGMNKGVIKRRT